MLKSLAFHQAGLPRWGQHMYLDVYHENSEAKGKNEKRQMESWSWHLAVWKQNPACSVPASSMPWSHLSLSPVNRGLGVSGPQQPACCCLLSCISIALPGACFLTGGAGGPTHTQTRRLPYSLSHHCIVIGIPDVCKPPQFSA